MTRAERSVERDRFRPFNLSDLPVMTRFFMVNCLTWRRMEVSEPAI
jgi:hypothetical protein